MKGRRQKAEGRRLPSLTDDGPGRWTRCGMIPPMGDIAAKFVVSPAGRKEAVLLGVAQYRRLLRKIEDLKDALALDRAERTSKKLISYFSVSRRLKAAGELRGASHCERSKEVETAR